MNKLLGFIDVVRGITQINKPSLHKQDQGIKERLYDEIIMSAKQGYSCATLVTDYKDKFIVNSIADQLEKHGFVCSISYHVSDSGVSMVMLGVNWKED